MKYPRFLRRCALFLALILTLGVAGLSALAETAPEPTGVPFDNSGLDRDHSIFIGRYYVYEDADRIDALSTVKYTLYKYGYYGNISQDSIGLSNKLDDSTIYALRDCCDKNGMMDLFRWEGLTYGVWDRISKGDIINLNAPAEATEAPEKYAEIPFGESGENLPDIANVLFSLGYLDSRDHATYDEAVRDAIREFGKNNGFPDYYDHDEEGHVRPIEADLQRTMLEEKALNTIPPEQKPSGLMGYFSRIVKIGGLKVSMLVLWCVGLVVLVGGALLAVYIFTPAEARKSKKATKNMLHFSITYNGTTQETETQIEKTLKIGRGIGNFPLNMEDMMISRRHCELYYNNNALMLRDYSANGTTVNGKAVNNAECLLHSGDTIVIGNHTIVITF